MSLRIDLCFLREQWLRSEVFYILPLGIFQIVYAITIILDTLVVEKYDAVERQKY